MWISKKTHYSNLDMLAKMMDENYDLRKKLEEYESKCTYAETGCGDCRVKVKECERR